jgi:predicted nucleotidyltransferase
MKFGLEDSTISAINTVFAQFSDIKKAILYGSRAKGTFHAGSDIDLTLIAPTYNTDTILRIENVLEDLMLPYKIDLSLLHQIDSEELKEHINRIGVTFYEK